MKLHRSLLMLAIVAWLVSGCSLLEPAVEVSETKSNIAATDEMIHLNNCGGKADSKQVAQHSFSTSFEGAASLKVGYQALEGSVSARYGQYKNVSKSQELTAPAGTNMEFLLRWTEQEWVGNLLANGQAASYNARVPMSVELISSQDLGCETESQPVQPASAPTSRAIQPQPALTPVRRLPQPNRLCPMIVIEGTVGGLPVTQTKTWSELAMQGTTQEPQSASLSETCSRKSDNKVQVWIGYWSRDPSYLDFRRTMTVDEAISLVGQNPNQPVIIVPWSE